MIEVKMVNWPQQKTLCENSDLVGHCIEGSSWLVDYFHTPMGQFLSKI